MYRLDVGPTGELGPAVRDGLGMRDREPMSDRGFRTLAVVIEDAVLLLVSSAVVKNVLRSGAVHSPRRKASIAALILGPFSPAMCGGLLSSRLDRLPFLPVLRGSHAGEGVGVLRVLSG